MRRALSCASVSTDMAPVQARERQSMRAPGQTRLRMPFCERQRPAFVSTWGNLPLALRRNQAVMPALWHKILLSC